jgi:hypothetical protein
MVNATCPVEPAPAASRLYQLLCAVLRDEALSREQLGALLTWPDLLAQLDAHGVASLARHKLRRQRQALQEWATLWAALSQQARRHTAERLLREAELGQTLDDLAEHSVRPILLKGIPLGHSHYPAPEMRACGDADLLIRQDDRPCLDRLLRQRGYTPVATLSGRFVMHQATYLKTGIAGVQHAIDAHWKISNRQVFAHCLAYDELAAAARPIPALGDNALAPAPEHALLHACLHRVAHQAQRHRLIWLYDLHLLIENMSADETARFNDLAARRELRAVCWDGLQRAQQCFATRLPQALQTPPGNVETSAYFLTPRRHPWQVLGADLRALAGWGNRLRLVREHLFPPAAYMRARYDATRQVSLPMLYGYRLLLGLRRFCRVLPAPFRRGNRRRDMQRQPYL